MTIAIIGWGSLLWDLDDLAAHVSGSWAHAVGPALPLEFVLVSAKRRNALTVVIDHDHGEPCASSVIMSARGSLGQARLDLAARERCPPRDVGMLHKQTGAAHSRSPDTLTRIAAWLAGSAYDAAVWTDSARNFEHHTGQPYSVANAMRYLRALRGAALHEAKRYIDNAPGVVDTPLRRALRADPWWAALPHPDRVRRGTAC